MGWQQRSLPRAGGARPRMDRLPTAAVPWLGRRHLPLEPLSEIPAPLRIHPPPIPFPLAPARLRATPHPAQTCYFGTRAASIERVCSRGSLRSGARLRPSRAGAATLRGRGRVGAVAARSSGFARACSLSRGADTNAGPINEEVARSPRGRIWSEVVHQPCPVAPSSFRTRELALLARPPPPRDRHSSFPTSRQTLVVLAFHFAANTSLREL
jgi:hypothetical protein